jgi:opacity protein-like surface antigen
MKKTSLLALVAIATTAFTATANGARAQAPIVPEPHTVFASGVTPYVAARGFHDWQKFDVNLYDRVFSIPESKFQDDDTYTTYGGKVAVGVSTRYDALRGALRSELEFGFRDTFEEKYNLPNTAIVNYNVKQRSLLANFYYDIKNSTHFTPYISAGLGENHFDVKIIHGINVPVPDTTSRAVNHGSVHEKNWNFAWQVGFGVSYAFNENVSFDAGYWYSSLGEINATVFNARDDAYATDITNTSIGISNHEVTVGVRYNF